MSRKKKLLYSLVCFAIVLVAGEMALRARAWMKYGSRTAAESVLELDPELGFPAPRRGWEQRGSRVSIAINSLGFRGREIRSQKPPGTIRIACLGGSTTFCAEASDDGATWPARLESMLAARYPDRQFEVINAGVPGYTISRSIERFERRILPLEPDLVLVYHATNDMAQDTRLLAQEAGILDAGESYMPGLARSLSKYSLLFDLAYKNLKILAAGAGRDENAVLTHLPSSLPSRFIGDLDRLRAQLEERGVPLVLSCFLTRYRRDQDPAVQVASANIAFYYTPWMSLERLLDAMDLYNRAIVEFAREHSLPVAAETSSIPGDAEHFADAYHFTDAGCKKMAARMFALLEASGVLAPVVERVGAAGAGTR